MTLNVPPERIIDAAKFVDTTSDDLIDRHLRVTEQINSLLNKGWTGSAADAYRTAWDEWDQGFRRVISGLKKEVYVLQSNVSQFISAENTTAANIVDAERNL
ncbi:MAG: WXG100 family type VII secretion target [Mycobacterium sp.]